jgi:hypothetical protein
MAITRIQFTDLNGSSAYTLPINPHEIDIKDEGSYEIIEVVDGYPIKNSKLADSYIRKMVWPEYLSSNTTFTGMLSTLKSYINKSKRMNLQDVDYLSQGWKEIKIIDVRTWVLRGGDVRVGAELLYQYI